MSYFHKENRSYAVKVSSGDVVKEFSVFLRPKEFIIQYLSIDPNVAAATRNEKSAAEMQQKVYPLKPVTDPVRYWEGEFIMPVDGGRVNPKDFGKRRYVNDAPTSYRHNGLDIGHDEGTPIKATNNGRVLLAEYLIETGNTIIIEHGYGLQVMALSYERSVCQSRGYGEKGGYYRDRRLNGLLDGSPSSFFIHDQRRVDQSNHHY